MKKILAIVLAMALLCITAIGTTLSYFTDKDYDKNVMTVGTVGITQKINGQDAGVAETTKLFPAVIDGTTINNAVDMNVVATLEDSSEDAYVRTIYAFEMMKVGTQFVDPLQKDSNNVATIYCVGGQTLNPTDITIFKDNTWYAIYVSNTAKLDKVNKTFESLKQIFLGPQVGNEFYGAVGNSYDILVVSQAVQAQGFANAADAFAAAFPYGENNANVASWFTAPTTP